MNNNQNKILQQSNFRETGNSSQYQFEDTNEKKLQRKCINCGWGVSETADICENCGEWLLKGKCNFCYTEVEEGQKFCSECGNTPDGIHCPSCGTLSHFDFCPKCNASLTEQARETINLIINSIEFQNLNKINESEIFSTKETEKQSDIELKNLESYLSKFTEQKHKKKNSFSLNDNSNVKIEDNITNMEHSRQAIAKEERRKVELQQAEIQALKLLEESRSKTFSSNQEARKYFGALKILLPKVVQTRVPKGWTCNAYGCFHPGGPQECADPSLGGTWSYDSITEQTFIEIEI
jgi:hypothetical protein